MNKELFEKLGELRIQEREIKGKIDEIYPEICNSVKDLDDGTMIETPIGVFTVSHRRTWEYSKDYDKAAEELKKQKKEEEQMGTATYTTKPSVLFTTLE